MAESNTATKTKMVKIRIPRTRVDEEDVVVRVNLKRWLIKRGVEVEVPECVAAVLREQEALREERMLNEARKRK